jgi:hypothetical protein
MEGWNKNWFVSTKLKTSLREFQLWALSSPAIFEQGIDSLVSDFKGDLLKINILFLINKHCSKLGQKASTYSL